MKSLSKVEVKGLEALFYDELISLVSGFTYKKFFAKAIKNMNIRQNQSILDFGCGSGIALCSFLNYTKGEIIGLDIGKTMLYRAFKKCKQYSNVKIFKHDIRQFAPFLVDKVFISFVLHGFEPKDREKIIHNAYANLKQNGEFCILDYSEFDYYSKPLWFKKLFGHFECPLAVEFINTPIKEVLRSTGFSAFYEYYYYNGLVRLLVAKK
jgi:demethylmenaquinone methyltransferase/2-methoxy-6-polyprenyl-1,4-benzoquinol methylase